MKLSEQVMIKLMERRGLKEGNITQAVVRGAVVGATVTAASILYKRQHYKSLASKETDPKKKKRYEKLFIKWNVISKYGLPGWKIYKNKHGIKNVEDWLNS